MELTIATTFDWDTFVDQFWDRRPVLYKGIDVAPFVEQEVFDAAVRATRTPHPLAMPGNVQFTIALRQQTQPRDLMPELSDGSFNGYESRMIRRLHDQPYALVVNRFHSFHHPQWTRVKRFYAGLWERVGQPNHSAISTMFHGTYEHSPVGVHQDRFATFMFCVRGTKRMRFWATRPWTDPVHTVLDYEPYLASSFVAEAELGDLLYWPARFYHVGESAGGSTPATSVNVGIPRREHRAHYEIEDLFHHTEPKVEAAPLTKDAGADGQLSGELPAALEQAVEEFARCLRTDRMRKRATALALQVGTAGGFWPAPPLDELRTLNDDTPVRASDQILFAPNTNQYAANGNLATEGFSAIGHALLERLRAGEIIRVKDLPAGEREQGRQLLRELVSLRAVTHVADH